MLPSVRHGREVPFPDLWRNELIWLPFAIAVPALLTSALSPASLTSLCLPPAVAPSAKWFITRLTLARLSGWGSASLLCWIVMVVGMVPLLAVPMLRFVAARSYASRRLRASLLFLLAALTPWLLLGLVPIGVLLMTPESPGSHSLLAAAGFACAGLWQVTPWKGRALQACHRTQPLAANAPRADAQCLQFGWRYGWRCIGSCWILMIACALAGHTWQWTAVALAIAWHERTRRQVAAGWSASLLFALALLMLLPRTGI